MEEEEGEVEGQWEGRGGEDEEEEEEEGGGGEEEEEIYNIHSDFSDLGMSKIQGNK